MPLQIRRGTDAERLAMTQPLAQGELLYVTNTQKIYVGNGSTLAGSLTSVTGYTNADAKDAAAAAFTGGTHSGITFTYNTATDLISANVDLSNYQGILRGDLKGSVFADDSTMLVDAVSGTIVGPVTGNITGNVTGNVTGNITGIVTGTAGSSLIGNVTGNVTGDVTGYHTGDVKGSVFADDSTMLVDAVSGTIVGTVTGPVIGIVTGTAGSSLIGNVTGDVTGDVTGYHTGDVKGSVFADDSTMLVDAVSGTIVGTVTGPVIGIVTGAAGSSLIGNVTGDVTGYHTGDVKGSVFADDSTLLVDAVSGTISATSITGNIFTNLIDSANSSAITFTPAVIFNSDVTVDNDLFANLTGNVIGNVIGNVQGNVVTSSGNLLLDTSNQTFNGNSINLDDGGTIVSPGLLNISAAALLFTVAEPTLNLANTSIFVQNNSGAHTSPLGLTRVRGTFAAPTTVLNGDDLGQIVGAGFDGTNFALASSINIVVDGAVSSGAIPSRIDISTANTAGAIAVRASIKSTVVEFAVPPRLPVVADDTARTALVPSPAKGMMIFMESGTSPVAVNAAQVFNGSNWVNL